MSRIKHEDFINVIYTSLNFRDFMIATDKFNMSLSVSESSFERNNSYFFGMEFVGFDTNRQRIMGLCSHG